MYFLVSHEYGNNYLNFQCGLFMDDKGVRYGEFNLDMRGGARCTRRISLINSHSLFILPVIRHKLTPFRDKFINIFSIVFCLEISR